MINERLKRLKKHAKSKGGRLVSTQYINSKTKYIWECENGHQWSASANNVMKSKNATWCAECSGKAKLGLDKLIEAAKKNDGKLLSKKYVNRTTKYEWQCKFGHKWFASASNILIDGHWCHDCSGFKRIEIKELQNIAKSKGGKLLSSEMNTLDSYYDWECAHGHRWEASGEKVLRIGTWCPICGKSNISEEKFRLTIEAMLGTKFPKKRPNWLRNVRGNKMELDGYNKDYQIAFEYNGIQHYKSIPFLHTNSNLKQRIEDDRTKLELCKQNNILLIVVPYSVTVDNYEKFIKNELEKVNKSHLVKSKYQINYSSIYNENKGWNRLNEYVKEKKGVLLSFEWKGVKAKYRVKCNIHNHEWEANCDSLINKGTWCHYCGVEANRNAEKQRGYEALILFAEKNEARLESTSYEGQYGTYRFTCHNGHEVNIPWKSRKRRDSFCKVCKSKMRL